MTSVYIYALGRLHGLPIYKMAMASRFANGNFCTLTGLYELPLAPGQYLGGGGFVLPGPCKSRRVMIDSIMRLGVDRNTAAAVIRK